MSLKFVHILFIVCSSALSVLLTFLFFGNYRDSSVALWMWLGMLSLVASVSLPAYGVAFYRKLKKLGIY